MATRTLSRRALRDQYDAEPDEREEDVDDGGGDAADESPKPRARKTAAKPKAPAKPRARKKAVKVLERTVARWAVCDNGAKRVAVFEYKDRAGADAKLADVRARKPGTYYLALVKDPYDPPAEPAVTA
ncbi:MAG: hypothetical protein J0I06_17675 [Planctomycetes bacterium]|nr:hypothetical protein [Planctomycetota bacterium]